MKKYLKHDNLLDLDSLDLFSELNILKEIIGLKNDKPIDILNYIKRINFLFSELNILKEIIELKNDKPIDILNYIKRIIFFSKYIYNI